MGIHPSLEWSAMVSEFDEENFFHLRTTLVLQIYERRTPCTSSKDYFVAKIQSAILCFDPNTRRSIVFKYWLFE